MRGEGRASRREADGEGEERVGRKEREGDGRSEDLVAGRTLAEEEMRVVEEATDAIETCLSLSLFSLGNTYLSVCVNERTSLFVVEV